jgi:hypothetical protein
MSEIQSSPRFVKLLAGLLIVLGIFAGAGSLLLWGQGFLFVFPTGIPLASP